MLIEVQVVEEFSFQSRFSAEISSDQKHRLAELKSTLSPQNMQKPSFVFPSITGIWSKRFP
jgi:hypothetical protein